VKNLPLNTNYFRNKPWRFR